MVNGHAGLANTAKMPYVKLFVCSWALKCKKKPIYIYAELQINLKSNFKNF